MPPVYCIPFLLFSTHVLIMIPAGPNLGREKCYEKNGHCTRHWDGKGGREGGEEKNKTGNRDCNAAGGNRGEVDRLA